MESIGLWQISDSGPARLRVGELAAERDLEDWIERDPALVEHGLVIVGRQVRLEGGPLDLLALDPQGRWVLIEIKRERLQREVVAQAIDYASCLNRLEPARLRAQCDEYLRSRGRTESLDALLAQRGQSLDDETDGRNVVIYLVGTGYDPGLERMVSYLADQADLSLRIVTFSPFRDSQGALFLAKDIHETEEEPRGSTNRRPSTPSPDAEAVLAVADQNGVGGVVRTLYDAAVRLGLHVRAWKRSIMIAPPANRTRCLLVVWTDRRAREPGMAKAFISSEAFQQFYGITEADLAAAVGPVGAYVTLDQAAAQRVGAGIQRLLMTTE